MTASRADREPSKGQHRSTSFLKVLLPLRGLSIVQVRLAQLPVASDLLGFLRQLHSPTRVSTLRAVVDGVFVAITLRKHGVRPLLTSPRSGTAALDPGRSMSVAAAVDAGLGLIPVAPTCLRRSVTLIRELNRLHLGSTLHIGVRKVSDNIEAHAWVQVSDVVVNDDPEVTETYVELAAGDVERLLPLFR